MHITIHLTLKVGSSPLHVTPYFILGQNRRNVWFGMKEGSGPPGCILYLSSFSSEYTWVLFNGPNGHWVTPGQPSNTLFKSHNTQAQDFWTRRVMANKKSYVNWKYVSFSFVVIFSSPSAHSVMAWPVSRAIAFFFVCGGGCKIWYLNQISIYLGQLLKKRI